MRDAHYFTTDDVTIEADPTQYVDIDGEVTTRTPSRFTVAVEALNVMVPQDVKEPFG